MMFEPFPKIPRLRRECTITEKIDGTNAQVAIVSPGEANALADQFVEPLARVGELFLYAGSRSRWLDTSKTGDNFGFAKWVAANADELSKLGPGRHFGEWYGLGIQRGYGLTGRRFALFNTDRWGDPTARPVCCDVTPVLYRGVFSDAAVESALHTLREHGSRAAGANGPMRYEPEGVIVFMHASRALYKVTLDKDELSKGAQ